MTRAGANAWHSRPHCYVAQPLPLTSFAKALNTRRRCHPSGPRLQTLPIYLLVPMNASTRADARGVGRQVPRSRQESWLHPQRGPSFSRFCREPLNWRAGCVKAGPSCGSFPRKGEVFVYVGSIHNLKDLKKALSREGLEWMEERVLTMKDPRLDFMYQ